MKCENNSEKCVGDASRLNSFQSIEFEYFKDFGKQDCCGAVVTVRKYFQSPKNCLDFLFNEFFLSTGQTFQAETMERGSDVE
jgi:hypothetical protein